MFLLGVSGGPLEGWDKWDRDQGYTLIVDPENVEGRICVYTDGPMPREGAHVWFYGITRAREYVVPTQFPPSPTAYCPVIEDTPEMKFLYAAVKFWARAVQGPAPRSRRTSVKNSFPPPRRR